MDDLPTQSRWEDLLSPQYFCAICSHVIIKPLVNCPHFSLGLSPTIPTIPLGNDSHLAHQLPLTHIPASCDLFLPLGPVMVIAFTDIAFTVPERELQFPLWNSYSSNFTTSQI
jgi:hypothetical protein